MATVTKIAEQLMEVMGPSINQTKGNVCY